MTRLTTSVGGACVTPNSQVSTAPGLVLADGTVEALKWLALVFMTLDHVNKYLLHDSVLALFAIGRLALPLFAFVLGYNLSRPGVLARGVYKRVAARLSVYGGIASVPFTALGGLGWSWWPLNIMAMLLAATLIAWLLELGGWWRVALATLLFLVGGSSVEFWWPGVAACLCAWSYSRRPSWPMLALWISSIALLYVINKNFWALVAMPIIFAAPHVTVNVRRVRHVFYVYYPAHLGLLWVLTR